MSVQAISAVLEHSEARGSARVVMFVLADHADEYGLCWPGINRLAQKSRITRRNAQKHLYQLQEGGELGVFYREGKSNVYRILLPGLRSIDHEALAKLHAWGVEIDTGVEIDMASESTPKPKAFYKGVVNKNLSKNPSTGICFFCRAALDPAGYCPAGCEVAS